MTFTKGLLITGAVVCALTVAAGATLVFFRPATERALAELMPRMEKAASDAVGAPVHVERIEPVVAWPLPEVRFYGLLIGGSGGGIALKQGTLRLDLVRSASQRRPVFGKLTLEGLSVPVTRDSEGRWSVGGLKTDSVSGTGSTDETLSTAAWLARSLEVELRDLSVTLPEGRELRLAKGEARYELSGAEFKSRWVLSALEIRDRKLWPELRDATLSLGHAEFALDGSASRFQIRDAHAALAQVSLQGAGTYDREARSLELSLALPAAKVSALRHAIPKPLLPFKARKWIDSALPAGEIRNGKVELRGHPDAWRGLESFNGKSEHLLVELPLEAQSLSFLEGWSALTGVRAKFWIRDSASGAKIGFTGEKSNLDGIQLTAIEGTLSDLDQESPLLRLSVGIRSEEEPLLRFVKEGPLKAKFESLLKQGTPAGTFAGRLRAAIPLGEPKEGEDEDAPELTLELEQATVRSVGLDPEVRIEALSGTVEVTEDEVTLEGVKGKYAGELITVAGVMRAKGSSKLEVSGHLSPTELSKRASESLVTKFVPKGIAAKATLAFTEGTLATVDGEGSAPDFKSKMQWTPKSWSAQVQTPSASGDLKGGWPISPKSRVEATFKNLWLRGAENPEAQASPTPSPTPVAWKNFPSFEFKCDDLRLGEEKFGAVSVRARQTPEALELEQLTLNAPTFDLRLDEGRVIHTPDAGDPLTRVSGKMRVRSYERKFKMIQSLEAMKLENGGAKFFLRWPGGLEAFSLAKVEGEISGNFRQGILTGVRAGYQSLFNFFSMNPGDARKRQLRFFKSAFAVRLQSGKWTLDPARELVGSVFVRVTGSTDMNTKTHNLVIKVVPGTSDICEENFGGLESEPNCGELPVEPGGLTWNGKMTGSWDDPDVSWTIF